MEMAGEQGKGRLEWREWLASSTDSQSEGGDEGVELEYQLAGMASDGQEPEKQ